MSQLNRRHVLALGGLAFLFAKSAHADEPAAPACLAQQSQVTTESNQSPFFQHFHQLSIPVLALLQLPDDGVVVTTSPMDQGSYDVEGFKKFIASASLTEQSLIAHSHDVKITKGGLARIASGEKDVEIRVVSANGNYVHNFLITASPSTLAKVRRHQKGLLKI